MGAYKAKQLIVVRKDLKMRKGKIAAQAGHACVEATLKALLRYNLTENLYDTAGHMVGLEATDNASREAAALIDWFGAGVAKICVYVNSEDELLHLADIAEKHQLTYALICDAGHTEFHGQPTYTCLAFEPLYPEVIDPICGDLPLY